MQQISYHFAPPAAIARQRMQAIAGLIAKGGLIDTGRVAENLAHAFLVAFALRQGQVVGTCALKRPRPAYLADLMQRSGLDLTGYLERGYTSVAEDCRQRGVAQALVDGLTARAAGRPVYVVIAEGNEGAQRTSMAAGTEKKAVFPAARDGRPLGLWVQSYKPAVPLFIGLITTRDESYHPNRRLLEAARARGHRAVLIHPHFHRPAVEGGCLGVAGPNPDPQIILPRVGAEISDYTLGLVRAFELLGRRVVNGSAAIAACRNQAYAQQALAAAGLPAAGGVLVNNREQLLAAASDLGGWPLVAKQVSGRQGRGVVLLRGPEQAEALAADDLPPRLGVLLQRFIPPEGRQDLRILVLDDEVAGAMELRPAPGDFRANYHLTGWARAVEPGPELCGLALAAAGALGLTIAGVDVIVSPDGPVIMEVNYSPGFKGLEAATGLDIAGRVVRMLEMGPCQATTHIG